LVASHGHFWPRTATGTNRSCPARRRRDDVRTAVGTLLLPSVEMRRLALALAGLLALAACSTGSSSSADTTAPATTAATVASGGTSPSSSTSADPLAGVRVPDAFTSVTVRPVSASTFPFLGSDQKYHVAYDLILTNASRVPATIDKVDVVDAAHPDTVV